MKKSVFLLLITVAMFGCAYEGHSIRDYIEDPRSIIRDPHFTEYKKNRDNLEIQYLNGKMTYADYVEAMDELDMHYNKEVAERDEKATHQ